MDLARSISLPLTGKRSKSSLSPLIYRFFTTLPMETTVVTQSVNSVASTRNSNGSSDLLTNIAVRK